MRFNVIAGLLLATCACSHGPPQSEAAKVERHDEWVLALRSDIDRLGTADGFEGRVRVLRAGKAEIDQSFGQAACLPLGVGRRILAAVAVGALVDAGKLGFDDRLERRLPSVAGTSFNALTVADLLTDSAGLAPTQGDTLRVRLEAAGKVPLQARPGTRIDPDDNRPWLLVEQLVAQVSGETFERFVQSRVTERAGMSATSLGPTAACPELTAGTTTVDDQFRLIDALRKASVVTVATREALWAPRLGLGPGSEVGYGFYLRTNGEQQAVGVGSNFSGPAFELWLDPGSSDALVLLGRTPTRTAKEVKTALGEFYALPPGPPHASAPARGPTGR
jgi:hypothetical protein